MLIKQELNQNQEGNTLHPAGTYFPILEKRDDHRPVIQPYLLFLQSCIPWSIPVAFLHRNNAVKSSILNGETRNK